MSSNSNQLPTSDHDLLVRLDERVHELVIWSKRHDADHIRISNRVFLAVSGAIAAIVAAILNFIFMK